MRPKHLLMILAMLTLSTWAEVNRAVPGAATSPGASSDTGAPAALSGVVRLDGPAPAAKPISMSKDPECMKMHPGGATTEETITGSDGTLGNVIVYVSEGMTLPSVPSGP